MSNYVILDTKYSIMVVDEFKDFNVGTIGPT